ncbi:MAG: hypothetical protein KIT31_15295 [Deltaproteobacteria bacterium]|nr:hypothetical protein [Deltaproteobacteria bacterium]
MSRLLGLGLVALAGCTLEPITETEREPFTVDRGSRCPHAASYAFESRGWGAPNRPDVMICSPDAHHTAAIEIACLAGETAKLAATPPGLSCGPNLATAGHRDRRECVVVQPARAIEVRATCSNWWGAVVYRASDHAGLAP